MKSPRLHIVGSSPRSGTTLLFELISACFDIQKVGDHEVSLFSAPRTITGPYASKKPTDLIHAARVLRWDPQLHVIYMQRDPRDVIVSEHGSRPGEYWCDFDVWRRNQALRHKIGNHPRVYECRYEALVREPDAEQERIAESFSFLNPLHSFSEFERVCHTTDSANLALKGVRSVCDSSVGTWRRDLPRIAAQLQSHPDMATALVDAGYEADLSWTGELQNVAPDHRESVRSLHNVLRDKSPLAKATARLIRRGRTLRDETLYAFGYRRAL
jgi:hypothetical protein